jgi:colanic acid biosynthesis glycosyl transferase WcaI
MRILYLTQFFEPEPAFKGTSFVQALAAAGHDIEVATGFPNYPGGKLYDGFTIKPWQREQKPGFLLHRLALYPSHDTSSIGRALNYLSFFVSALLFCLFNARRFDVVYVYHPPITVGLAAALGCWPWRVPFLLEIQDLWPDSVLTTGMSGTGRLGGILSALCAFTYKRAACLVPQSFGMARVLEERGVPAARIAPIRNWAADAPAEAPPLAPPLSAGRFTLVYGGNLGAAQALDSVIRAAHLAGQTNPAIDLLLMGDGIEAPALKALVATLGASNVRFGGRVSNREIIDIFSRADALVMHLAADPLFEITIPSKTQFYMAMGRPILAGVSGEAAELLNQCGGALVVAPQDVQGLKDAMLALAAMSLDERMGMGASARSWYSSNLSFDAGIAATLRLFDQTLRAFQGKPPLAD